MESAVVVVYGCGGELKVNGQWSTVNGGWAFLDDFDLEVAQFNYFL